MLLRGSPLAAAVRGFVLDLCRYGAAQPHSCTVQGGRDAHRAGLAPARSAPSRGPAGPAVLLRPGRAAAGARRNGETACHHQRRGAHPQGALCHPLHGTPGKHPAVWQAPCDRVRGGTAGLSPRPSGVTRAKRTRDACGGSHPQVTQKAEKASLHAGASLVSAGTGICCFFFF